MTIGISRDPIYRRRRFSAETMSMHQNSAVKISLAKRIGPSRPGGVRYPRKVSFGRNLYLLVMPKGGRYWRYCYRYGGKRKTLALGTYPDVPIDEAQSKAFIADIELERRVSAIGAYNFLTGLIYVPASLAAGALWVISPVIAFLVAACLALAAMVAFAILRPDLGHESGGILGQS